MIRARRRLVDLGHERIVLTTTPERVAPHPAMFEQVFLDELKQLGLSAGRYNLAAIDEQAGGLSCATIVVQSI